MSSKQLTTKRCCAYKSYILKSDATSVVIIIITIKISVQEEKKLSINLIKSV